MSLAIRVAVPVLIIVLALSACSSGEDTPQGQQVEIVAGGGADAAAPRALDARIGGTLRDLDVGRDGVLRLLTSDDDGVTIWRVQEDGALKKIVLDSAVPAAAQVTAAADGTAYVSSDVSLWKVGEDGAATRVVGDGERGFTPDGRPATGRSGEIQGVAVDAEGRVLYTEGLAQGDRLLSMVRRVEPDGTLSTIAGTQAGPASDDDLATALQTAADPPAGTKARDLALPGGYYSVLTAGDDGTVYVNGKESVLAVAPDGTARAVVAGRDPEAVKSAERPFGAEGRAEDATTPLYGTAVPPNLSASAGRLAVTSWATAQWPPAGYRWSGGFTEGQSAVIDAAFDGQEGSSRTTWPLIRLVGPDGTITTAAWGARSASIHDDRLYLVLGDRQRGLLIGQVRIPG